MDVHKIVTILSTPPWGIPSISLDWLKSVIRGRLNLRDFLIIKNGSTCKKSVYVRPSKDAMLQLVDRLYFMEGCTLYLRKMEIYGRVFLRLKKELQKEYPKHSIQLNAFFTPTGSYALDAHADDHDLLIIQISGSKKWYFWQPLPEAACIGLDANQISICSLQHANKCTVEQEIILEAGSYFFMGKGTIHKALCLGEPSIHLSVWLEHD